MENLTIGGPEIIMILIILALWWLLSFLPRKAVLAASTVLIAFTPAPQPPAAPAPIPAVERDETVLA